MGRKKREQFDLFQTDLEFKEVEFPSWNKKMLNYYKSPFEYPATHENVEKCRQKELKSSKSLMGKYVTGKFYKLPRIEDAEIIIDDFSIKLRIYIPNNKPDNPVFIYYHGGGYVTGAIETYDKFCRRLAFETRNVVISAAYRLAPEYKYPAAIEDAKSILKWTFDEIENYQGDRSQIYIIGDSAGGGICAILGANQDEKMKSKVNSLKGQILLYPWVDHNQNYESHKKFGNGYVLSNEELQFFTDCYKNNDEEIKNPDFSPINTADLNDAIRSLIILASHDPLRDSGIEYTKKLLNANIDTSLKIYQPTIHGFIHTYTILPRGKEIMQDFFKTLKEFMNSNPKRS